MSKQDALKQFLSANYVHDDGHEPIGFSILMHKFNEAVPESQIKNPNEFDLYMADISPKKRVKQNSVFYLRPKESQDYTVYVIHCEEKDKRYCGYTQKSLERRLSEHSSTGSTGAKWLSNKKPLKIVPVKTFIDEKEALHFEYLHTIWLMHELGVENVRGARFTTDIITHEERKRIKDDQCHYINLCYNCMQPGHLTNKCPNPKCMAQVQCYNCGKFGHYRSECKS